MSVKIFFTDLDGTLLTDDKQVSPATYAILDRWTHGGNKLVLCSGRALDSISHVRESLQLTFPNMYLIGCNGGEILDCTPGEILTRLTLSVDTVLEAFRLAKEYDIYLQTYSQTHILTPRAGAELEYYRQIIHTPYLCREEIGDLLAEEPCKCLAIELKDPGKLERFRQAIAKHFEKELTVLYSNPQYLELFPCESGKGRGVRWLCNHLGIELSNALAAGDEINDISMLEAAGLGIAMKNGREEVKKSADAITSADNNHDGLVSFLEQAMLP